jgi:hypothetical protein
MGLSREHTKGSAGSEAACGAGRQGSAHGAPTPRLQGEKVGHEVSGPGAALGMCAQRVMEPGTSETHCFVMCVNRVCLGTCVLPHA